VSAADRDLPAARAVQFVAPYRVEVADVPLPEPAPGEALVRTDYSGISGGTEMLVYRGEVDSSLPRDEALAALGGTFSYPFTYGYSAVGTVETSRCDLAEGERVFAFHPHQDRFVVPAEHVVPLGEADARGATLFPLVETAIQLGLDAGMRYGEYAVVLGLGPIGILAGLVLARGGALVVGSDPRAWRCDAARACGLEPVAPEALGDVVRERSSGRGADLVLEASGNPAALGDALDLLAREGVALVASWYGEKRVELPLGGAFHRRRLEIRSSQVSTLGQRAARWDRRRRLDATRALLDELPLSALATHTFAFEQAPDAYAALDRGEQGLVHAALAYS
jgi:2-desacetyl-2-hydroxyethyl bacteriochlorophyllide A dehydrogenase